jgi:predicted nucleotidyltransferase component of viral defense system
VIDIGFGDAIEPGVTELELPVLLDLPPPRLRAYSRETVIAEKFQAMVALGRANSRMKDLYDIWLLSRSYQFKGDALSRAIAATFSRRKTLVPVDPPYALTRAFADDRAKQQQWASFVESIGAQRPPLAEIIDDLAMFLMPHTAKASTQNIIE